ncbi:MAG TPA: class I SAM-dependent methyltransferase [Allosphingosinicella sp.]|jgi:SAM-dependent methyltransferase
MANAPATLLRTARELNAAGRHAEALEAARLALRQAPGDADSKRLAARLLGRFPATAGLAWRDDIARLLVDPAIDPMMVAPAGWHLLLAPGGSLSAHAGNGAALARSIEADDFALALLDQAYVTRLDAEHILTGLRRWLLLSGAWPDFPRLVAALAAQAEHNGGAWLFEADERREIDAKPGAAIAAAYRPPVVETAGESFADPVVEAVADQYRRWPYPPWTRVTVPPATTIPAEVAAVDPGRPSGLPVEAEMLVAGCGTGREAAIAAFRYPDARITAIDISETSVAYAAGKCREGPPAGIDFRAMDLNRVAELGRRFHFIACSGVLHHLPDPEAGWAALAGVLEPGGVMRVMLYSERARAPVRAAQALLADLRGRPPDGDLLREARRRLLSAAPATLEGALDFYTLQGLYDLLLHPQEDSFDVPRIGRALGALGLDLLAFDLPSPALRARYRWDHPGDPAMRDLDAWAALEREQPFLFRSMHRFWCRKPAR